MSVGFRRAETADGTVQAWVHAEGKLNFKGNALAPQVHSFQASGKAGGRTPKVEKKEICLSGEIMACDITFSFCLSGRNEYYHRHNHKILRAY